MEPDSLCKSLYRTKHSYAVKLKSRYTDLDKIMDLFVPRKKQQFRLQLAEAEQVIPAALVVRRLRHST